MHRVVRQDVGHQLGQREDAEHHADGQPEQEGAVDLLPEALEVALEERLPGLLFHQAVQGLYDLLVDARNEGDRAPGNTRYDIGRPHEIALQGCEKSVTFHPRWLPGLPPDVRSARGTASRTRSSGQSCGRTSRKRDRRRARRRYRT